MNKRWIYLILVLSLTFNVTFLSMFVFHRVNHPPMPPIPGEMPPDGPRPKLWEGMDLSEDEHQKLHEMKEAFIPEIRKIRWRLHHERLAMGELLMAAEPDSTAIEKQLVLIAELQTEMERIVTFHLLSQRKMLPQDKQKQFMENIMHRFKELNPADGPGRKPPYKNMKSDRSFQEGVKNEN